VPVQAINFARRATNTSNSSTRLITPQQAQAATNQANQMLTDLQSKNPDLAADNPTASYVIEGSNGQFTARPVVLGITDGVSYEVLDGLQSGESVVVGASTGQSSTPGSGG
jgi:ABC-type uncharacterized transport system substrate-binding protein